MKDWAVRITSASRESLTRLRSVMWLSVCLGFAIGPSLTIYAQSNSQPQQLAVKIDAQIAARWADENVVPAPPADDAEFIRRVYLDVAGKIPHASEVRDFLANDSPDKRAEVVERLIDSPSYVIHYTNLWRAAMVPEAENDQQIRQTLPSFESWLRSRIAEDQPFDEIVSEMLTLPVDSESVNAFNQIDQPTPAAFYIAKEAQPERLAAATARLFLGVRIDCAQCHDHPFDDWKQEQFWQYAAFFTDMPDLLNPDLDDESAQELQTGAIAIPETDKVVEAAFLGSADSLPDTAVRDRTALADWIVSADNPYFARAVVNRVWSYHFGIGLVEPMDDFSPHNPASHPELLEILAEAFIESGYDFRFLIRAITRSKTYQLTSRQTDPSQSRRSLFARMPVRGMSAEQLFDSLAVATGYRQPFDPEQPLNFNDDESRQEFIATFGNQVEAAPDRASTILQALTLMNGAFVNDATDIRQSRTLSAIIDAPFLNRSEQIDAMYLTIVARYPDSVEQRQMFEYLNAADSDSPVESRLADIFWVLLNSSEFLLNH